MSALGIAFAIMAFECGAAAEPASISDQRVQYIAAALDGLRATDPATLADLRDHLYAAGRGKCKSAFDSFRLRCLIAEARSLCSVGPSERRLQCHRVTDLMVTNLLGDRAFVDKQTRYELMRKRGDFRANLDRALRAGYAELALEFGLSEHYSPGDADVAAGIANFCVAHANARGLSWQRCVAAIVWHIGTSEIEEPK